MENGFLIESRKLSSVIEALEIDRRAYHLLKRVGINRISDIVVLNRSRILSIKGMGELTANNIISAVANYLNIPESDVFNMKMFSNVANSKDVKFDPLLIAINDAFDLPVSTQRYLSSCGIVTVNDLLAWLKSETKGKYHIGNLSKTEIRRINTELSQYFEKISIDKDKVIFVNANVQIKTDLGKILPIIIRDERTLKIIELRSINLMTLDAISLEIGGVTRERVRQIIDQFLERLRKQLSTLIPAFDYLEDIARIITNKVENEDIELNLLIEQFYSSLSNSNFIAEKSDLRILLSVTRLLAITEKPWSYEFLNTRWKTLLKLACFAAPAIESHKAVSDYFDKKREESRRLSYKDIALMILSKEKRPMHWSEIAEHAYRMGRRESFNSTALYNSLMNYPKLFVRVDAGTYALVEWGLKQADYYPDIIASILKSSKKPLSADTIFNRVNEIREVKRSTLNMSLDMHPRFYKSLEKTYGLRAWLPPREKQTLRTPEWLVEESDSYKRLEQANQRGYNIDNMIQYDIENN